VTLSRKCCRDTLQSVRHRRDSPVSCIGSVVDKVALVKECLVLNGAMAQLGRLTANCATPAEQRRGMPSRKVECWMRRTVRVVNANKRRWRQPLTSATNGCSEQGVPVRLAVHQNTNRICSETCNQPRSWRRGGMCSQCPAENTGRAAALRTD